jgi:hypothetical protein
VVLSRRRDLIEPFGAGWKAPLAVGVVAGVAYLVIADDPPCRSSAFS